MVTEGATKVIAVTTLSGDGIDLGFIRLHLVRNEGVAFGLGRNASAGLVLAGTATVVAGLVIAI